MSIATHTGRSGLENAAVLTTGDTIQDRFDDPLRDIDIVHLTELK